MASQNANMGINDLPNLVPDNIESGTQPTPLPIVDQDENSLDLPITLQEIHTNNQDGIADFVLNNMEQLVHRPIADPGQQLPHSSTNRGILLNTHFELLCFIGFSPIRGNGQIVTLYYLIPFLLLSTIAIFDNLVDLKQFYIYHAKEKNLLHLITGIYFAHVLFKSIYFAALFFFEKIPDLLKLLSLMNENVQTTYNKTASRFLAISTLMAWLASFAVSIGITDIVDGFSAKEVTLLLAKRFAVRMFVWSSENADYVTDAVQNQYASEITGVVVIMAITVIIIQFYSWFQGFMINDIYVSACLELYFACKGCVDLVESIDELNAETLTQVWEAYLRVHEISRGINRSFGGLFVNIHLNNWLYCAYFLFDTFEGNYGWLSLTIRVFAVFKMFISYYCADFCSTLEGTVTYQLHKKSRQGVGNLEDQRLKMEIVFVERKIVNSPVGIGTRTFYVDEAYILKIVGSVFSSFLLFRNAMKDMPS